MATPEENSRDSCPRLFFGKSLEDIIRSIHERNASERERLAEMYARFGPGPGCHQIPCAVCGTLFYSKTSAAKYCSYVCNTRAKTASRKARREQARQKQCARCEEPFVATRKDAKYCSSACRQAHYRKSLRQ